MKFEAALLLLGKAEAIAAAAAKRCLDEWREPNETECSMSRIVVERNFAVPQSDADMKAVADRERPCLGIYNVAWRRSLVATDRMRMVCEYEAADAETVKKVQREAAAQFDRIYVADVIE